MTRPAGGDRLAAKRTSTEVNRTPDGASWAELAAEEPRQTRCSVCSHDDRRAFVADACAKRIEQLAAGRRSWTIGQLERVMRERFGFDQSKSVLVNCVRDHHGAGRGSIEAPKVRA